MRKETKIKSLFNDTNYIEYMELIKAAKIPHEIIMSNYTLEIKSDLYNYQFMQNMMSEKAFIAHQMIKRDIKLNNLLPPDITSDNLEYYKFSIPNRLMQTKGTIFNIDIRSAYATVLLNHQIINQGTFNYMSQLMKKDRLACVGMLAGKKNIFSYDLDGEFIDVELTENPQSNFFYFCIWQVQQLMLHVRSLINNNFLFYWVDGIYFEGEENTAIIGDYLISKGYRYSFDKLTDFNYRENNKHFSIFFKKDEEQKVFNIPKPNTEIAKQIINILGLHDDNYSNELLLKMKQQ